MNLNTSILSSTLKLFRYYKSLGEKSLAQVSDAQLQQLPGRGDNSLAVIVKHLWGNMMSRWTDFLQSDGEKEWRKRDEEFVGDLESRAAIMEKWEEGWACLFSALEGMQGEDLARIVYIRNEGHTAIEAIQRQLGHYAYHIGQMVYLAKMLKGEDFQSLSIPKGGSKSYNQGKFSEDKERKHFTDEV